MRNRIPDRFPVELLDAAIMAFSRIGEVMIQMELEFDRPLDAERLRQALALTLEAEPLLGCRLMTSPRYYWERLPPEQQVYLRQAENDAAYETFKTEPHDSRTGPLLKVCWRPTAHSDRLLLKFAHEIADAGACKEIAAIFSGIYNRLAVEPRYRPTPNLAGSRSVWQITKYLPKTAYPQIYRNFIREKCEALAPVAKADLFGLERRGPLSLVTQDISVGQVNVMMEYGKRYGATINDIMMTAFFRAFYRVGFGGTGQPRLRLGFSVDLRRYLPSGRGEGICNLSSLEGFSMKMNPEEDFAASLARVATFFKRRKQSWIGLNEVIGVVPTLTFMPLDWLLRLGGMFLVLGLKLGNFRQVLTNMGEIRPEAVTFGIKPTRALLLVPPMHPPLLGAGLSGYSGSLTLSGGAYPEAKPKVGVERFFQAVIEELPR